MRPSPAPCARRLPHLVACLALLAILGACGTSRPYHAAQHHYSPSRYYPPPGPASDPWGPYIREASGRFGVPENWIRKVMRQESGGQEDVISWAGAMGLMQVMPDTYDELRPRYSLGDDPFDPHNNILAGTAYLKEMYDRYGSPGFLAAYNAGPNRLDHYLYGGTPLPAETVSYVASIAPLLGSDRPMSGPLAVYAGGPRVVQVGARPTSLGCDPDAAYNPDGPCTPLRPAVTSAAATSAPLPICDPDAAYDPSHPCRSVPYTLPTAAAPVVTATALPVCDPDAAYDPSHPCRSMPYRSPANAAPVVAAAASPVCDPDAAYDPSHPCVSVVPPPPLAIPSVSAASLPVCDPDAAYDPSQRCRDLPIPPRPSTPAPLRYSARHRPIQESMGQPVAFSSQPPVGHWMIQVGAFASLSIAEAAAERARAAAPDLLTMTKIELPATVPFGNQVAFRARLSGLTPAAASEACSRLSSHGIACITVPPPQTAF